MPPIERTSSALGPDVVAGHHRAEPLRGGDRLQPGHARAQHEDLAEGPCRRRSRTAEEPGQAHRRLEHPDPAISACEVSASIDRAREIRGAHRERRDLPVAQSPTPSSSVDGEQNPIVIAPGRSFAIGLRSGRTCSRTSTSRPDGLHHLRARPRVRLVGGQGVLAGPGLDTDLQSRRGQLSHNIGERGDPALPGSCLGGDHDVHG